MSFKKIYVLVRFNRDWADEFDTFGFLVCTKEHWESLFSFAQQFEFPREEYFGSNEAHEYENFEDYMKDLKVHEINEELAYALRGIFTGNNKPTEEIRFEKGIFPNFEE